MLAPKSPMAMEFGSEVVLVLTSVSPLKSAPQYLSDEGFLSDQLLRLILDSVQMAKRSTTASPLVLDLPSQTDQYSADAPDRSDP